jgi:hypothetical protein
MHSSFDQVEKIRCGGEILELFRRGTNPITQRFHAEPSSNLDWQWAHSLGRSFGYDCERALNILCVIVCQHTGVTYYFVVQLGIGMIAW